MKGKLRLNDYRNCMAGFFLAKNGFLEKDLPTILAYQFIGDNSERSG